MADSFVRRPNSPVRVFVSYAHQDRVLMQGLVDRLNATGGVFKFQVFSDLELLAGDAFEERLPEWLQEAQIILLLVSQDYLDSPKAASEVEAALRRRQGGHVAVVPVLLTGAKWQDAPYANLQALPQDGQPVVYWERPEDAFASITRSLIQLVENRTVRESSRTPTRHDNSPRSPFRILWLAYSSCLLFGSLLFLAWYSAYPPKGVSSTPIFLFNSAVVGLAAMSLIQISRRLVRIRGAFHRDAINRWLHGSAMEELEDRVGNARIDDVFDLPSEMLAGQLSAIAEQALEEKVGSTAPSPLVQGMAEAGVPPVRERQKAAAETSESAPDNRATLALAIQRNLDHFQIATAASWRRYLLLTSILLSMVLFTLGLQLFKEGAFIPPLTDAPPNFQLWFGNFTALLACALLVGLFGGFLGSIARDIVAIIEKLRR